MSTFNIHSANRMLPGPSGMGAKVVQGHLSLIQKTEAVHPDDVKLNTIKALFVASPSIGSMVTVRVFAAGTVDRWMDHGTAHPNFASLQLFDMSGSEAPVDLAGTLEAEFLAFGE
ncbi:unnamed protein product [marine sediment metagenome]|uniref:Uncharacterized protein n=1 Tax=marine sediment metagenome TaxID=412755 RepID=X1DVT5_9ZZZZ